MKIELERMLELIKTLLLVVIVIFLSLNFYSEGAESKYEIYGNGRFLLLFFLFWFTHETKKLHL